MFSTKLNFPWLPDQAAATCSQNSELPHRHLITSVFSLCFDEQDKLLLINHEHRGWDVPGGHVESGETLEESLYRELKEEAAANIYDASVFARIENQLGDIVPDGYRYPIPTSYMICFISRLQELEPFDAEFETTDRKLFTPEEVRLTAWYETHGELYEAALNKIKTRG